MNYHVHRILSGIYICAMIAMAFWPAQGIAKMSSPSLGSLVSSAEQIMYVEKMQNPATDLHVDETQPVVMYRVLAVLKGERKDVVAVCNQNYGVEWPQFDRSSERLVIFVFKHGSCYAPVWGHASAVQDDNGTAHTWAISGEPEKQDIKIFLRKIRSLVAERASRDASGSNSYFRSIEEVLRKSDVKMALTASLSVKDKSGSVHTFGRFNVTNMGKAVLVLSGKQREAGFELAYPDATLFIEIAPGIWSDFSYPYDQSESVQDQLKIAPGSFADVIVRTDIDGDTKIFNEQANYYLWFRVIIKNLPNHENIGSEPFLIKNTGLVPVPLTY